jgi:hypothetical protein
MQSPEGRGGRWLKRVREEVVTPTDRSPCWKDKCDLHRPCERCLRTAKEALARLQCVQARVTRTILPALALCSMSPSAKLMAGSSSGREEVEFAENVRLRATELVRNEGEERGTRTGRDGITGRKWRHEINRMVGGRQERGRGEPRRGSRTDVKGRGRLCSRTRCECTHP